MNLREFPEFDNGDVQIHFSLDQRPYRLHANILSQHSHWFRNSLRGVGAGSGGHPATDPRRHSYELRFHRGSDFAALVEEFSPINDAEFLRVGRPHPSHPVDLLFARRLDTIKAHKALFAFLYHVPSEIALDSKRWTEEVKPFAKLLASLARMYGLTEVVQLPIEFQLRMNHRDVLRDCCASPLDMLDFATVAHSTRLFKIISAVIIGMPDPTYDLCTQELQFMGVADLFRRKRAALVALMREREHDLFLVDDHHHDMVDPGFVQNALGFFRFLVADRVGAKKAGSGMAPSYADVYHMIRKGATGGVEDGVEASELIGWLIGNRCECSEMDVHRMREELAPMFRAAYAKLADLFVDLTRCRDSDPHLHGQLTCVGVEADEVPWAEGR